MASLAIRYSSSAVAVPSTTFSASPSFTCVPNALYAIETRNGKPGGEWAVAVPNSWV